MKHFFLDPLIQLTFGHKKRIKAHISKNAKRRQAASSAAVSDSVAFGHHKRSPRKKIHCSPRAICIHIFPLSRTFPMQQSVVWLLLKAPATPRCIAQRRIILLEPSYDLCTLPCEIYWEISDSGGICGAGQQMAAACGDSGFTILDTMMHSYMAMALPLLLFLTICLALILSISRVIAAFKLVSPSQTHLPHCFFCLCAMNKHGSHKKMQANKQTNK